jgi:hypothetical protein
LPGVKSGRPTYGRYIWLSDSQVDITGPEPQWFSRFITEVTDVEGLQRGANLAVTFEPGCQTVGVHRIRVWRAGTWRESDPLLGMQLMRREQNLDRAIFDGRVTAYFAIPDIRVGDIVDVSYTVIGATPLLTRRFAAEWLLNWAAFVAERRVRLIARTSRHLVIKLWNGAPQPDEITLGDTITRSWQLQTVEPVQLEPLMPGSVRPYMSVSICDAMSWADVAMEFMPGYVDEQIPSELIDEVEKIRVASADAAEQIILALRLVQGSLRYQAVGIGESGYVPRSLSEIWSSRTGDCKDASKLLVSVLTQLRIPAYPILVNTMRRHALAQEPPNIAAFNHSVVSAHIGEQRYWLDPTRYPQYGPLGRVQQPRFDVGLPLQANASLETIDEDLPSADSIEAHYTVTLPRRVSLPATLRSRVVFSGRRADSLRRQLAADRDKLFRDRIASYGQHYGSVSHAEPPCISDDTERNSIEVDEVLSLPKPWQVSNGRAAFRSVDRIFEATLPAVRPDERRFPFVVKGPLIRSSILEIRMPIGIRWRGWNFTQSVGGVHIESRLEKRFWRSRTGKLHGRLLISQPVMPPSQAADYAKLRTDVLPKASVVVRAPVVAGYVFPLGWKRLVWFLVIIFFLALGQYLQQRNSAPLATAPTTDWLQNFPLPIQ